MHQDTFFKFLVLALGWKGFSSECATINVTPKESIQAAVDEAQPGDTVVLGDGEYAQDFKSVRDGTPENRITITGSRKAVVHGKSNSRMIEINHSYITLDGFTASGLSSSSDGSKPEDFVDKCVYVLGTNPPEAVRENGAEYESSLDGMVVSNMHLKECGGECLRLRSFITNAEVVGNKIEGCGRHDFSFESTSVNGEAIYVGTSSNQWDDGKNSRAGPDLSKYIWIHENEIDSQGNECVDVKEGTTDVLVEYNVCSDQRDPNSACLDSRTDDIIFRYNEVLDCDGAGIRIGGHTIDGKVYGVNNEVYGNIFSKTTHSSVKVMTGDDHNLCENECKGECVLKSKSDALTGIEDACQSMRDIPWITPGKVSTHGRKTTDEEEQQKGPAIEVTTESKDSKDSKNSEDSINSEDSKCNPAKIKASTSSGHDGNPPHNAVDGNAVTRWSKKGKGAWLAIEFVKEEPVKSLEMSFYKGDKRQQFFDVYGDGKPLLLKMKSSGKSTGLQKFTMEKSTNLKRVTIFGNGNSEDEWNSITEVMVCTDNCDEVAHDDPAGEENECDTFELEIAELKASADDGNKVENLVGKDLKTRWSCKPEDSKSLCDVTLLMKEPSYVAEVEFAVYEGNERVQKYDIAVQREGAEAWEDIVVDGESRLMKGVQSVDIDVDRVSKMKFVGYGNDKNEWNSLVSLGVIGC
ncbi:unnamed protein product [Sphacelaria rigidula]